MANAGLDGPYLLNFNEINLMVRRNSSGVFALGELNQDRRFAISFVGGSYTDVRRHLLESIGTAPMFKLRAGMNAAAAFLKLCELFHTFHPSGNFVHPERPPGSDLRCPYCTVARGSASRFGGYH